MTGGRGSGKTTRLAGLLDFHRREGRRPEGFIAEAEGRCREGTGADRYTLRWPLRGEEIVLCERVATGHPPYRFSEEAWTHVGRWAEALREGDPPEVSSCLIILALSGSSAGSLLALALRIVGIVAALFVILSVMKPERWTRHHHDRLPLYDGRPALSWVEDILGK